MHQSFVTTAPPSTLPMGNSGDNDFSSIKALHCGVLLRVIAQLFIIVNSKGVYLRNVASSALTLKRSLPRTLAPLSPAYPCRRGALSGVTNERCSIVSHSKRAFLAKMSLRLIMYTVFVLWGQYDGGSIQLFPTFLRNSQNYQPQSVAQGCNNGFICPNFSGIFTLSFFKLPLQ